MAITRLALKDFTGFAEAQFDFVDGINVLVGANGTGKSHALKLVYGLHEAVRRSVQEWKTSGQPEGEFASIQFRAIEQALKSLFQPDRAQNLIRREVTHRIAHLTTHWTGRVALTIDVHRDGGLSVGSGPPPKNALPAALFLPPREVLSMYPGFIAAYQSRESAFDRTYYDLCVALSALPLRDARNTARMRVLKPLESVLGGRVVLRDGRFYIHDKLGDLEAPLLAEGLRKIAMLAHLAANGHLEAGSLLVWDEPEAGLNPNMAPLIAHLCRDLARAGVQIILATHDYALASEISLPDPKLPQPEIRFFALGRVGDDGAQVVSAPTFAELERNPILDALASLHDRELERSLRGDA